jgi:hypothetical protein
MAGGALFRGEKRCFAGGLAIELPLRAMLIEA